MTCTLVEPPERAPHGPQDLQLDLAGELVRRERVLQHLVGQDRRGQLGGLAGAHSNMFVQASAP